MIKILQDQIDIELGRKPDDQGRVSWISEIDFKYIPLTNRFLNHLFANYTCHEYTIHFYDSQPEIDDCLSDMAYDYAFGFVDTPENKAAYLEECRLFDEYNQSLQRLTRINWIDVYGPGIWNHTPNQVDGMCYEELSRIRRGNISCKDRLFVGKHSNGNLCIYYYSRDYDFVDHWFIFEPRKKKLKRIPFSRKKI